MAVRAVLDRPESFNLLSKAGTVGTPFGLMCCITKSLFRNQKWIRISEICRPFSSNSTDPPPPETRLGEVFGRSE
jgi:hypothetical protein